MRFFLLILFTTVIYSARAQRTCSSVNYQDHTLEAGIISAEELLQAENFIDRSLNTPRVLATPQGITGSIPVIKIPVVVHILYNHPVQNIPDEQIFSQIRILNEDFRKRNADLAQVPEKFRSLAADCQFEFQLATTDMQGKPSSGIIRKATSIQVFGLDDRIKFSELGGDDAWDASSYLNIWVGNLAGGLIGYSSPLGGPVGRDGIVVRSTALGNTGTARAPFNRGRTLTHEIGHWMGLFHIWGDSYCGDDRVQDTPQQQSASTGCPSGNIPSCTNTGNMYMNFMDLTDDACMGMFSEGQRKRMRAAFQPGGPRYSIFQSAGLSLPATMVELPLPAEVKKTGAVAPNPTTGIVVFSDPAFDQTGNYHATIINQFGQTVQSLRISGSPQTINLQFLPAGIYYLLSPHRRKPYLIIKK